MGVTLERVQFKFASIIGELCSEPDILSQFAVWVDLRLAEYKLKGSISLDCSGETPDPIWLKGIVSVLLAKQLAMRQKNTASLSRPSAAPTPHMRSPISTPKGHRSGHHSPAVHGTSPIDRLRPTAGSDDGRDHGDMQAVELRLSPDIVIKEEPSEDGVYPVSLHCHDDTTENSPLGGARDHRKRSATETVTGDVESLSGSHYSPQSSAKVRRLDPASNESLMSIIGLGEQSHDSSSVSVDNINSDIEFVMASESGYKHTADTFHMGDNSSAHPGTSSASTVGRDLEFAAGDFAGNTERKDDSEKGPNTPLVKHEAELPSPIVGWSDMRPHTCTLPMWRLDKSITPKTKKNTVSAAGIFERWLSGSQQDYRKIQEIPPAELDDFLINFFGTIKKNTGEDYDHESFRKLRSNLDRYLRDQGYPCSISKSGLFGRSTAAFHRRRDGIRIAQITCLTDKMVANDIQLTMK